MLEKCEEISEGELGLPSATEHRVELKADSAPLNMPSCRAGSHKREEVRNQIEYGPDAGVIEPAQTVWPCRIYLET